MKKVNRLLYLDWMRGLAAVIMLQGHVFQSFTRDDLRTGGAYVFSQFLGGMPPAIFLFLTGITLAFLMDSQERKNLGPFARWTGAMGRAGYLFAIAFAFRLQLWAFSRYFSPGANSPWTELLKVDVLNCMGFGMGMMSILVLLRTRQRVYVCAALGTAIALASPLISQAGLPGWPPLLRDYVLPNYNFFAFFPWAAFIAFGLSFGSFLRVAKPELISKAMQTSALAGVGLGFGACALSGWIDGFYAKTEFWLNAPSLTLIKLGVLLVVIAFCYVWMLQPSAQGWSWIRQLGTTSLLVYWIHIELVYGHWLGWMKSNLSVGETIVAAVAIILAMLGLSYSRTSWPQWKQTLLAGWSSPLPQRVSGD